MIVLDDLRDCLSEVPRTDWNDAIGTFFSDRPHESLGVGVRVRHALGSAPTGCPRPVADARHRGSFFDPDRRSQPAVGSRLSPPLLSASERSVA